MSKNQERPSGAVDQVMFEKVIRDNLSPEGVAGDGEVLVAVALAGGAWAAGVAAALLKLGGHGGLP